MEETWLDIFGYEGQYQVSNMGLIRALDRYVIKKNGHICFQKGKIIKQTTHPKGYMYVSLSRYNSCHSFKVHRIVAIHFVPNPLHLKEVNHIDGDKTNNCAVNLEWNTTQQNMYHAYVNGLRNHKLTNEQVLEIFYSNLSTKALCEKFTISDNTVYDIKSGKTRSIITGKKFICIPTNIKYISKKYLQ